MIPLMVLIGESTLHHISVCVDIYCSWAQDTLRMHWDDKREILYSLEQLEQAQTGDRLWNAAQLEMVNKYRYKFNFANIIMRQIVVKCMDLCECIGQRRYRIRCY